MYLPKQKLINSFTAIVTVTSVVGTGNVAEPQFMEKFFPYAHKYSRSVMDLVMLYVRFLNVCMILMVLF